MQTFHLALYPENKDHREKSSPFKFNYKNSDYVIYLLKNFILNNLEDN